MHDEGVFAKSPREHDIQEPLMAHQLESKAIEQRLSGT
jgi:hypothetical protein